MMDTTKIQQRLREAGTWTKGPYEGVTLPQCTRDSAPFEAADMLAMQDRELAQLRAKLQAQALQILALTGEVATAIDAERERAETLWRALEIIGVGDAANPVATAREALMAYGHWERANVGAKA